MCYFLEMIVPEKVLGVNVVYQAIAQLRIKMDKTDLETYCPT